MCYIIRKKDLQIITFNFVNGGTFNFIAKSLMLVDHGQRLINNQLVNTSLQSN